MVMGITSGQLPSVLVLSAQQIELWEINGGL